jgi:hypothetical protein
MKIVHIIQTDHQNGTRDQYIEPHFNRVISSSMKLGAKTAAAIPAFFGPFYDKSAHLPASELRALRKVPPQ